MVNGKSKPNLGRCTYQATAPIIRKAHTPVRLRATKRVYCLSILTTVQLSLELFEQRHHLFTTHVQNKLELVNIEPVTHPGVSAIYYSVQHLCFTISLQCDIHLYMVYKYIYIYICIHYIYMVHVPKIRHFRSPGGPF